MDQDLREKKQGIVDMATAIALGVSFLGLCVAPVVAKAVEYRGSADNLAMGIGVFSLIWALVTLPYSSLDSRNR